MRIARCLTAGLAVLFCSATASATKVRADFYGTITAGDSIFQGPGGESSTYSGFYIFETGDNNPDQEPFVESRGSYEWLCFELVTPGMVVFSQGGLRPITVVNDDGGRDWYKVQGVHSTGVAYTLFMEDDTGTVFSDDSLPSSVDTSDFDTAVGFWRLDDEFSLETMIGTIDSLTFSITETCDCTPPNGDGIPTPAALPAGLALLMGLAAHRRRRRSIKLHR